MVLPETRPAAFVSRLSGGFLAVRSFPKCRTWHHQPKKAVAAPPIRRPRSTPSNHKQRSHLWFCPCHALGFPRPPQEKRGSPNGPAPGPGPKPAPRPGEPSRGFRSSPRACPARWWPSSRARPSSGPSPGRCFLGANLLQGMLGLESFFAKKLNGFSVLNHQKLNVHSVEQKVTEFSVGLVLLAGEQPS